MPQPAQRITRALISQPWAITEDYLRLMLAIAQRESLDVAAVETQLGRKLENTYTVTERNGVAIIPVVGPIFRYANLFTQISGGTSVQLLARDFQAALHNPDVRSILLNIDSPGGEANGIAEFAQMIYDARATKPVTAYVGGLGASAAYWIASAAGELVANDTAMLGSIGTIVTVDDPNEDGEFTFVSHQSPRKKMDPTTEQGAGDIQGLVDALSQVFVETVARNRGVSADAVLADFGQGGILVGKSAVAAGMADRLGSFEGTLAQMSGRATPTAGARVSAPVLPARPGAAVGARTVLSAPHAAGGPRVDTQPTITKELFPMDENEVQQVVTPAEAPAPPATPTIMVSDPAVQAQVNELMAQMRQEAATTRALALEEARAQFAREMAEERAKAAINAYAQHATTATMQRQHALPFSAAEVVALLTETPSSSRVKVQAAFDKILEVGLVSFEEIGSGVEGGDEPTAQAQFEAAVNAKVATGMSKLNAMQAIGKEQPELYAAVQAETSRRGRVAVKGGK
jgi:ClpP class serine protease